MIILLFLSLIGIRIISCRCFQPRPILCCFWTTWFFGCSAFPYQHFIWADTTSTARWTKLVYTCDPVYEYRIRQNFRGGKLSQLCTKQTIHWKTFTVHQAHAIMYCTQQMIQGENFRGFRSFLANRESFPLESFAVYST